MAFDKAIDSARLDGALTATAEAIRNKTDSTEPITFDTNEGFKAAVEGISIGGDTEAAYNEGVEAGRKAEYDAFWDAYQKNGNQTNYSYAFAGFGWEKTFKPKYNIRPKHATGMFIQNGLQKDLVTHLENLNVTLDLSQAQNMDSIFYNAYFTRIGVVDATRCGNLSASFSYCNNLTKIDKIIVNENCTYSNVFSGCDKLENLTFEGVIAKNGLNFKWSTKLSKASITSVINCLSTTTSGLTVTFSKTAKETAFTASEWAMLAATRPNWTITLV